MPREGHIVPALLFQTPLGTSQALKSCQSNLASWGNWRVLPDYYGVRHAMTSLSRSATFGGVC